MSRPVYLDVWRLDVSPTAKLLAVRIEAYQGLSSGWCFASARTLGAEIGVHDEANIRRALRSLRNVGALLEVVAPGKPTRRRLVPLAETPVSTDPGQHGPGSVATPVSSDLHPGQHGPGTPVSTDRRGGIEEGSTSSDGGPQGPPPRHGHASPFGLALEVEKEASSWLD